MVVFDPLKVVITNYEEGKSELMPTENNTEGVNAGVRNMPFSRELWIEKDDFMEVPPKKIFSPGARADGEVEEWVHYQCDEAIKDSTGNVTELRCTYFPGKPQWLGHIGPACERGDTLGERCTCGAC